MFVIKADEKGSFLEILKILNQGGLIAYPTESSYALGARFDIEAALSKLYQIKGRPQGKAFPLIIPGPEILDSIASDISDSARKLMSKFWPGPLTLVVNARPGLSDYITEKGTVAVRVPGESFALSLVRESGFPITATSANPSGSPPACNIHTIQKYFGEHVDLIVDGGTSPGGPPSTIVDITGKETKILRTGAVRVITT